MIRSLMIWVVLNTGALMGMVPEELQQKINALRLQDQRISVLDKAHCALVTGIRNNVREVFVALRYLAPDGQLRWTNLAPVPCQPENDTFGLFAHGAKIVTIQSSRDSNHTNAIGHQIHFNPNDTTITVNQVETPRSALADPDTVATTITY